MADLTCGDVKLVAAIFGADPHGLGQKLGVPIHRPGHYCTECDKQLHAPSKSGLCASCRAARNWITVICDQCGTSVKRYAPFLVQAVGKRGQQKVFCNRQCSGRWLGLTHGFRVHPENWGRPRKHDYNLVWAIHVTMGLGAIRIGRMLGISPKVVSKILTTMRRSKR